ncbi:MAG: MFS transporter [Chloroflexi bacterium]|nr:MAG: MFS transporter [Chloroflexota bacterium]TMG12052.1 MAG: MFS transporter [Chloroflexota bacterium]
MDRALLLAGRGLRAFGFGFAAVLVGVHLELRGLSATSIGLTLGFGLAAASLSGLATTYLAARVGRRIALSLCGLLMALTGLDLAVATQGVWLIASGLTGMLGAASVDLGPFASVEQAALAESVSPLRRNIAFARYSLTAGLFNAAGGLAAGLGSGLNGSRGFFLLYAAIGLVTAGLPLFLTKRVESELHEPAFGALRRPEVRRVLAGLSALFALDSFAGGFVTNAVISYWLHVRFGAGPALLGPIFAGVALLQAVSYEVSGRLSGRFGLINTMVFTHLPSNVLLLLVAFSPTLGWAVGFLFARFLLSQMDVPARQAYVVSIVPPADRAAAVAVTGAARGVAQAFGPPIAGIAIGAAAFAVPFYAGGGLKIIYDVALYAAFRSRRAGHES